MKSTWMAVSVLALLALGQLSCGDKSYGTADSTGGVTSNPTAPDGSPPPGGGTTNPQPGIREEFINDLATPESCIFPWVFIVHFDGTFQAGPCTAGAPLATGIITAEELSTLSTLATPVITSNLNEPAECELFNGFGTDVFDITVESGATYRFYESNPQRVCTLDGRDNAAALAAHVRSLMAKYYPQRQL